MRIFFEEYQYPAEKMKGILDGITRLRNVNDKPPSTTYIGDIGLNSLFFSERFQNPAYTNGAPIFKTGKELMKFRKER